MRSTLDYFHRFFFFLIFLCSSTMRAQTDSSEKKIIRLNGYLKDLQSSLFVNRLDSNYLASLIHNRLNCSLRFSKNFSGRIEMRNRIFYGEQIKMIPDFGKNINRYNGLFDLSTLWINKKSFVIHSVIDRILLDYKTGSYHFTIGRQRINWGVSNIWNPNDIFNTYNFLDFDYEERQGVDAVRAVKNFKNTLSMEIAYKPGKTKDDHIGGMLFKVNKFKYDLQMLGGIYRQDAVLGIGWAGNIKDLGFKGEMNYFHPYQEKSMEKSSYNISLMADRTFKNNWYGSVSFLYNSNPVNTSLGGNSLYSSNLSPKALFPFRNNFYAGVLKELSPISNLNLAFIYSPENNTVILFPSITWNAANNLDIDLTAQAFFAESSKIYRMAATNIFLRGRFSF